MKLRRKSFLWALLALGWLCPLGLRAVEAIQPPTGQGSSPTAHAVSGSVEFDLSKDDGSIPPPPPDLGTGSKSNAEFSKSLSSSATFANTPSYLPKPPLVSAEAGNRAVQLGWYPSESPNPISGYLIFRGTDPAHLSRKHINRKPVTAPEFLDNDENSFRGPENRLTYYYGVRAVDEDGRISPMSDLVAASPNGPLLAPGKLKAVPEDGRIVLHWADAISSGVYDLSAYQLYRAESPGKYGGIYKVLPLSPPSFGDLAPNGKTYYYSMRSVDTLGNTSEASVEIKAAAFKSVKPPTELSGHGVGDQAVTLRWKASEGKGTYDVAAYNIYRSTLLPVDLGARPINKSPITGSTNFDDEPDNSTEAPKLNTNYHYMVVALDSEGNPSTPEGPVDASPTASLTGFKIQNQEIPGTGGSKLSIQGKKTIDIGYTNVSAIDGSTPGTPSGLNIKQQLRVNLTGEVGRKIKVDVDYDDSVTNADAQKISVVYTGDSQEVFKEFAFGDVLMDLGAGRTEWAGYTKHLFGAKVTLESPDTKFRLTAIGAQTKGYTETKQIYGGMEQAKTGNNLGRDILDSSFAAYHYYYLSRDWNLIEGSSFIVPGTVAIYYDQNGSNALLNTSLKAVPTADGKNQFNFRLLNLGTEYTVDFKTGTITFNIPISPLDSMAVCFTKQDLGGATTVVGGTPASFDFNPNNLQTDSVHGISDAGHHLIQYGKAGAISYDSHMSFQFYNLGNRDIIDPQLDPDFKLVIYGTDQKAVYQLNNRTDFSSVIQFDTRNGLMRFRVPYPFQQTLGSNPSQLALDPNPTIANGEIGTTFPGNNADIYHSQLATHNYTIHVEFKYKVPNYSLRPGIIRGSELITLNGRKLNRDADYFLDYDSGFISFSNPDLIKPDSVIQATYEYLPFGGQYTSTIWGARAEYDLPNGLSLGSTYLSNGSDAPLTTPDISSTPFSESLLDGDVQYKLTREKISDLLAGLTGNTKIPISAVLKTEVAQSNFNPNTFNQHNESGVAMIDSFESVNNIVSMSMIRDNLNQNAWTPSSRPITAAFPQSTGGLPRSDRLFSEVVTEQRQSYEAANNLLSANQNPQTNVMACHYSGFTDPNKWDAFVTAFSGSNNSLSNYDTMTMLVYADPGTNIALNVDIGQINEDSNDNGQLDYESTGIFTPAIDVGTWTSAIAGNSVCPGGPCYPLPNTGDPRYMDNNYWGIGNGCVDTEDVNRNGILDTVNSFYRITSTGFQLVGGQWNLIYIPLKNAQIFDVPGGVRDLIPGDNNYYTNLQAMRLWWNNAQAATGAFYIESIQFQGNKWQSRSDPTVSQFGAAVLPDTSKISAQAISSNNSATVDQGGVTYVPNINFFQVQVSTDVNREQSLELDYNLTSLDQTNGKPDYFVKRILTTSTTLDFGSYKNMRIDLFKPMANLLPGEIFILRLGVDDLNYFEYHVPLDSVPSDGQWHTQTFALDGSDGKRTVTGQPYLRSVGFASFAVLTFNGNLTTSSFGHEYFWIDNFRVTDAIA